MEQVGVVSELYRYPVKSMGGESLTEVQVTWTGVVGDRVWVVSRLSDGVIITAKVKEGEPLLSCKAEFQDGMAWITLPDGQRLTTNDLPGSALGQVLGKPVQLINRHEESWEEVPTNFI